MRWRIPCLIGAALVGCASERSAEPDAAATARAAAPAPKPEAPVELGPGRDGYHPLAHAIAAGETLTNREAPVPIQCYTKTDGVSNPCWTCHTTSQYPNLRNDEALQVEYAFSSYGETNHWSNAFADRSAEVAALTDDATLAYVREDNYSPARAILEGEVPQWAYPFDLDFAAGFDDDGFAKDGTHWRAFRYKPFPGTFWPTNGATDDAMIRLPTAFRSSGGEHASMVYRANLAVLEASFASDPSVDDAEIRWPTEPLDETVLGVDLDGDGVLEPGVRTLRGLPKTYFGDAADQAVRRRVYPQGTEFVHSVRYLDPDAPAMIATRMKELRYMRKEKNPLRRNYVAVYEAEADDKDKGVLPRYGGNAKTGLLNPFGWRIQGYIEDAQGRLRLQTYEEHMFCMGCHSSIGVTADSTFSFPRKVPGSAGWAYQSLEGMLDVPQVGHNKGEVHTYFERVGGGDELRANEELLTRFFAEGTLDHAEVARASIGGDRGLAFLVAPSRQRALALDKAYWALVKVQGFANGRDTLLAPPENVHPKIDNGSTGLEDANRTYRDGRLQLAWPL